MNEHFRCNCGLDFMFPDGLNFHLVQMENRELHYEVRQAVDQKNPIDETRVDKARVVFQEAKRNPSGVRYDILIPEFLYAMAKIGAVGVQKHNEDPDKPPNYQLSRLIGDRGPVNHMYEHLGNYQIGASYDHAGVGTHKKYHLAAIAFNAMMEFWYECQEKE